MTAWPFVDTFQLKHRPTLDGDIGPAVAVFGGGELTRLGK
jgi:hypothetical protein